MGSEIWNSEFPTQFRSRRRGSSYTDRHQLQNVWTSTALASGSWDEHTQQWNLTVRRDDVEEKISASYIVFAVGAGGQIPSSPQYPNMVHPLLRYGNICFIY